MLNCAVKFCGGCNPRFDRGQTYQTLKNALFPIAAFTIAEEEKVYDVLLIIRGCTGCSYEYEEIMAAHRVIVATPEDVEPAIRTIQTIYKCQEG